MRTAIAIVVFIAFMVFQLCLMYRDLTSECNAHDNNIEHCG